MIGKKVLFANLRAEMCKYGHTQKTIQNLLGISHVSLNNKLFGRVEFTKKEIDILCDFYKKSYEELFKGE